MNTAQVDLAALQLQARLNAAIRDFSPNAAC